MRADIALVARNLFPSRAKAAEAIAAGLVHVDGCCITKPSQPIAQSAQIEAIAPYPWVSRGGVKLAAALDRFGIDPSDCDCLDVGASTGGFTDVLLARGSRHVTAVDVGHGQMHPRVAADPRVTCLENFDARNLSSRDFVEPPSIIVIDVSFISLTSVLPKVLLLAPSTADLVVLVKPQFEGAPNKKGIVRNDAERLAARNRIAICIASLRWHVRGSFESPIAGGNGNREWFLHAVPSAL